MASALNAMPELAFVLTMDVVAQLDPAAAGSLASLLYDGHGSTRGLVDATGRLASGQIKAYDAFGVATSGQSPILTPLGYAGEWYDDLLQQAYHRHRYLNHATGTWNAFDAYEGQIGNPLMLHKYGYVHGNPIGGIDPSGERSLVGLLVTISVIAVVWSALNIAVGDAFTATMEGTLGMYGVKHSGKNVTNDLLRLRADVKQKFSALTPSQQQSLNDEMSWTSLSATVNWDISHFYEHEYFYGRNLSLPGSTYGTVTIDNDVYYVDDANYYFYGLILRTLDDWDGQSRLDGGLKKVGAYRVLGAIKPGMNIEGPGMRADIRKAFVRAGYYDDFSYINPYTEKNGIPAGVNSNGLTYTWGKGATVISGVTGP
jgi:RHS repeat-associated protein